MASMANEQLTAFAERLREIESIDAAARTAPFLSITAKDDHRPIEFLEEPRGHDPDDPNVPWRMAIDDDEIAVAPGFRSSDSLLQNFAPNSLPLAILGIKAAGDGPRLFELFTEEQVERFQSILQPARRVQARRELKACFISGDLCCNLCDFHQRQQPGTGGLV